MREPSLSFLIYNEFLSVLNLKSVGIGFPDAFKTLLSQTLIEDIAVGAAAVISSSPTLYSMGGLKNSL